MDIPAISLYMRTIVLTVYKFAHRRKFVCLSLCLFGSILWKQDPLSRFLKNFLHEDSVIAKVTGLGKNFVWLY